MFKSDRDNVFGRLQYYIPNGIEARDLPSPNERSDVRSF
jgi:hypothetical protein